MYVYLGNLSILLLLLAEYLDRNPKTQVIIYCTVMKRRQLGNRLIHPSSPPRRVSFTILSRGSSSSSSSSHIR